MNGSVTSGAELDGLGVRVLRNLSILGVSQGIGIGVSVITVAILSRTLSVEDFGAFNYAFAFLSLGLVLADPGLNTVLVRDAAQTPAHEAPLIQQAIGLKLALALAISAVACAGAFLFLEGAVRTACLIVCAILPLQALSLTSVVMQVRVQVTRGVIAELSNRLPGFAAMLAALALGWGLPGVMGSLVVGELTGLVAITALTWTLVAPRPRMDLRVWKQLLHAGLTIGGAAIVSTLVNRVDFVMLERLSSLQELGYYGAAYRLPQILERLPILAMATLFPLMARLALEDRAQLKVLYRWATKRAAIVVIPLAAAGLALAPWILRTWQGDAYMAAVPALRWLLLSTICVFIAVVAGNVLIVLKQARVVLFVWLGAAPVNIFLNWLWVPEHGAEGAATATFVTFLGVLIASLIAVERHLTDASRPDKNRDAR